MARNCSKARELRAKCIAGVKKICANTGCMSTRGCLTTPSLSSHNLRLTCDPNYLLLGGLYPSLTLEIGRSLGPQLGAAREKPACDRPESEGPWKKTTSKRLPAQGSAEVPRHPPLKIWTAWELRNVRRLESAACGTLGAVPTRSYRSRVLHDSAHSKRADHGRPCHSGARPKKPKH